MASGERLYTSPADRGNTGAERRRGTDLSPLSRLRPYLLAHWPHAALALLFLVGSSAATLGVTFAARSLADAGFAAHRAQAVDSRFLVMGAVALGLALATAGRFYFISRLGERVVADLRVDLFDRLIALDPGWFARQRRGEILSRLSTDLTMVESMVGGSVAVALRNLLTGAAGLAVLLILNVGLTGLVLLLALITIVPMARAGRRVRHLSARAQTRFSEALGYAAESLDALETVQAFTSEQETSRRFRGAVEQAFRASLSRIEARALLTALVMALVAGAVGVVLWRASLAAFVDQTMTGGALLQFVLVAVLTAGAAGSLGETWGDVQKTAGALQRISQILDARPAVAAPARPTPLPRPARGQIDFDAVRFVYPGRSDLPALRDFNLHVRPGESVALVGPSGAGKSTVFRLALRFYDPQSGRVSLDGVDLREADPREVRRRIATVAQNADLFTGSTLDNLRLAAPGAPREELVAALRAAQAAAFVEAMPGGIDASLGDRAKALSGGERQRLAIARAMLRDASVLLLDEATSALDSANEHLVQQALEQARRGRTVLTIAHRLATVLHADRIVVMNEGAVVDEGAHAELLARGGLYARLAALQFG